MTLEEILKRRDEMLGPAKQAASKIFSGPLGQEVLKLLEMRFCFDPVVKDPSGRVDSDATLINVGAARVVNYLRDLSKEKDRD